MNTQRRDQQIAAAERMVPQARVDRASRARSGEIIVQVGLRLPAAAGGATIVIKFILPAAFPARGAGPIVQLHDMAGNTLLCQHHWIDQYGQLVGHPDVAHWDYHKDLGVVIRDHIQEFTRRSPVVISGAAAAVGVRQPAVRTAPPRVVQAVAWTPTGGAPPPAAVARAAPVPLVRPQPAPQPAAAIQAPAAFAAVARLRREELSWLDAGGADGGASHREAFLLEQPECVALKQLRAKQRAAAERNAKSAEENLGLANQVRVLQAEVARLDAEAAVQATHVVEATARLEAAQAGYTAPRVIVRLMGAANVAKNAGRDVYEDYECSDGEMSVNKFCGAYVKAQRDYHHLRAKADKLRDLVHLGHQT
jgi:hypothetical protein